MFVKRVNTHFEWTYPTNEVRANPLAPGSSLINQAAMTLATRPKSSQNFPQYFRDISTFDARIYALGALALRRWATKSGS